MALKVKAIDSTPYDLSLISGTHMVEERTNSYWLSSDFYTWTTAHVYPHTKVIADFELR